LSRPVSGTVESNERVPLAGVGGRHAVVITMRDLRQQVSQSHSLVAMWTRSSGAYTPALCG